MRPIKRPVAHVLGERGENLVASTFLKHGWIVEKLATDYSYDFLLQITKGGVVVPAFAMLQVKTVKRVSPNGPCIRLFTSHLVHWMLTAIPVWLSLVDLSSASIFLVTIDDIVHSLQRRLGADWSTSRVRTFRLSERSLLTEERVHEFGNSLAAYWKTTQATWLKAREDAFKGMDVLHREADFYRTAILDRLAGMLALRKVVPQEAFLRAEYGDERAAALLSRAQVKPLLIGDAQVSLSPEFSVLKNDWNMGPEVYELYFDACIKAGRLLHLGEFIESIPGLVAAEDPRAQAVFLFLLKNLTREPSRGAANPGVAPDG